MKISRNNFIYGRKTVYQLIIARLQSEFCAKLVKL